MAPFDHDDGMLQHSLLDHILTEHPIIFTTNELVSELAANPDEFWERDRVERTIRDLTRARLLRCHGPLVLPTRAALYFSELWDEFA